MYCIALTLIRMALKKWVAVRLGVIYGSQATTRKQGGLPASSPLPRLRGSHILTPSRPEYTKTRPQTGSSYLCIEKSPKTAFYKDL
jgi:hypothetical protein